MVEFGGAYYFNQPFDWGLPRTQTRIKNTSGVWVDVSAYLGSMRVTQAAGYATDTFACVFSNSEAYISSNFSYAQEIEISATFNQYEQEILLLGKIERPKRSFNKSSGSTSTLTGKDLGSDLLNRIIPVEIYAKGTFTASTNPYIGEIVRDLINKYSTEINASAVANTATQIDYRVFANISLFDALKWLADLIGYRFYINQSSVLIFETIPTGVLVLDALTGPSGTPTGWTVQSGTWAQNGIAFKQTNATGSFSAYRTSETFTTSMANFDIVIDSGERAGAFFRVDGSGNGYFVALDITQNLIRLFSVAAWATSTELSIGIPISTLILATHYHLRIYCLDYSDNVLVMAFVDDMLLPVLYYRDYNNTFTFGKMGFRTEDAAASFMDFVGSNASLIIEEGFNATGIEIEDQLDRQKNNIYVIGGYEKFPKVEVITPSGSTNEITLASLPSETRVDIGATILKGGVKGIDDSDATVDYLVDYYGKKLQKRTGNWAASATTIYYNANVPIISNASDSATYATSGIRDYIQTNTSLNTQAAVDAQATALLDKMGTVPQLGTSTIVGAVWQMVAGDFVLVKSPSNGLTTYTLMIASTITINFDKSSGLSYDFKFNTEDASVALLLNSIERRLRAIESRGVARSTIRIETITDTMSAQDAITGESKDLTGTFRYGHYVKFGHGSKFGNSKTEFTSAF